MTHRLLLAVAATALALAGRTATCRAQMPAPRTIGFTGLLTDGQGIPRPDGEYTVRLALYTDPVGGAAAWTETKSVKAARGLFSTALGDAAPLPSTLDFSSAYFVGVRLGEDTEMTPRLALQGVPYALYAQNVANDPALLSRVSGGALTTDGGDVSLLRNHAAGVSPAERFTYAGHAPARNGLGWFDDPWHEAGPTAWLSGDGGIKLLTAGAPRAALTSDGLLGIGTETPAAALDVRGDIRFGAAGEWLTPGAQLPLQVIQGQVNGRNGTALLPGYSSARIGSGLYDVIVPNMSADATFVGTATATGSWTLSVASVTQSEDGATRFRVETRLGTFLNDPAVFAFIAIGTR